MRKIESIAIVGILAWCAEPAALGDFLGALQRLFSVCFGSLFGILALRAAGAIARRKEPELLDRAWGIIANVNGGNWQEADREWVAAAKKWRDDYLQFEDEG